MPNAVCSLLLDSGVRDLGVHTEMLTDGIIDLYQAGVVTGAAKTMHPGKIVCSFGLGSKTLYEAIDRQPRHLVPAGRADEPAAPHHAERPADGDQQHDPDGSPRPGRERVERSPPHQRHRWPAAVRPRRATRRTAAKSFICMSSTYERNGVRKSRVVLSLTPGNIATAPRSDMMYVVTEFGMVNLKGKSVPERAKAMISIAHPDFRDDLEREARANGLIPKPFG